MLQTASPGGKVGWRCELCERTSLETMILLEPGKQPEWPDYTFKPPRVICAECVRGMAEAMRFAGVCLTS